jgi:hypothetical protein
VPTKPEDSCRAFDSQSVELDPNVLHRFRIGADPGPQPLDKSAIEAELGDALARLVFTGDEFPASPSDLLAAVDEAIDDGDSLGPQSQLVFLLGEGSQIPFGEATRDLDRGLRFVVTRGSGPDGPDILVSALDPDGEFVEAMAWDQNAGGFNYYRTVVRDGAWVVAGNSADALSDPTHGKGPFESHTGGNFLMKEFRFPWIHWHSFKANIFPTAFAPDDPRRDHPWVTGPPDGANICEENVAKPAIERWTRVRFDKLVAAGTIDNPARILEHLVTTPTVNLASSATESRAAASTASIDLPQTFFVDSASLHEELGLEDPPAFRVASDVYRQSLATFEITLRGNNGFEQPGDTHFAFAVPEKAIEDITALREALGRGIVSRRLTACLLMVDFPNPIFSPRREKLLAHCPSSATVTHGASTFSEEMGEAIAAAAADAEDDSAEAEFAELWSLGEQFENPLNERLRQYYAAIETKLTSQAGFDDFMRLANSRRNRVREMPIFENRLLLPESNIEPGERAMQPDASVSEIS